MERRFSTVSVQHSIFASRKLILAVLQVYMKYNTGSFSFYCVFIYINMDFRNV